MATQKVSAEPIIEPDLPIIDPHHHLWHIPDATIHAMSGADAGKPTEHPIAYLMRTTQRYLLDDLLADINTGHNVRATVFIDAHAMYRADGPMEMKPVGETEFVNGIAAMSASGTYGAARVAAGIVGHANLNLGDAVEPVLRAHLNAGGGRFRGIRHLSGYDADPELSGKWSNCQPRMFYDPKFRAGFKWLHKLDLSFDACLFEPQIPDLTDLARAFPETTIILDHVGSPLGVGGYKGKLQERFPIWRDNIRALAKCENVAMKLGGLAMPLAGFPSFRSATPTTSAQLAAEWKPYIETCIAAFGAKRCMFESNFPVDSGSGTYPVIWNAFKRLVSGASKDDKTALFSGTAARVYRVTI